MFTFLITLAVVVMSIGVATAIAIKDPDQPATLRAHKRRDARRQRLAALAAIRAASGPPPGRHGARDGPRGRLWRSGHAGRLWRSGHAGRLWRSGHAGRPRRERTRAAEEPTRTLRVPVAATATVDGGGFSDHWLPAPARFNPWVRLRSGVVLTILLTLVGTLVAATVAGVLVFLALALRSAVS